MSTGRSKPGRSLGRSDPDGSVATAAELQDLDAAFRDFRSARLIEGGAPDPAQRSGAQRDADRILYSRAFRRLGGVTQVVAVSETELFHNRLTHSLKVAQIGARMTQHLRNRTDIERLEAAGGLDPDVVYAAALAHDLGHPPFGHIAEDELQAVLAGERDTADAQEPDGAAAALDSFEGNAQSFRIITKLAWRSDSEGDQSLNLTRATLAATLKYPWLRGAAPPGKDRKWGAYRSERRAFDFAVAAPPGGTRPDEWRSPEAVLMDWADDIAYAVHDVEDFFRAGLIPLDRLAQKGGREGQRFIAQTAADLDGKDGLTAGGAESAFETLSDRFLMREAYDGSRGHQVALGQLASTLITHFITHFISAVRVTASGEIKISDAARHEAEVLKKLTWYYMILTPGLATVQAGQRAQIRLLYRRLVSWVDENAAGHRPDRQLPVQLKEILSATRNDDEAVDEYTDDAILRRRAVVDYIVGLTEGQAASLAERFRGGLSASALAPWL